MTCPFGLPDGIPALGGGPDNSKRDGSGKGMGENAIEIEGVTKTYAAAGNQPPKEALAGIDLTIPRGSVFGLLGPNGAGKSTLINILAGLVVKSSGSVRIWGFDQDKNPRQSRASIGVMPQEPNIDPFFTPGALLDVQAGLYGVPKGERRTDEILAMVGLSDKKDAYARHLSGGMRRRLLLAKALVHAPPILVLDEPTAGVDIELRQMLWGQVRKLNEAGTTIILTTHYLEEAEEMCDEIAIIHHGSLLVRDTTSALLSTIDSRTLLITPDGDAPANITAPEGVDLDRRKGGALAFTYRRAQTSPGDIIDAVRASGITIRDIAIEEAHLEDVFLTLTRAQDAEAPAA